MITANQTPEQLVRDEIDKMLEASGWKVQSKKQINLTVSVGVAVWEYHTNIGPADYILFVNKKPVGVIEAKREEEAVRLTMHEEQSVPIVYESTGEVTRFTDYRDPKPRSRPVFTFHRPEANKEKGLANVTN